MTATIVTNSWTSTSIQARVPTGATTGNIVVHASGVDSNATPFTIVSITGLSPTSGGRGSIVTISGSGFGSAQGISTVRIGTANAMIIPPWTATSITAAVPNGAATGSVTVRVSVGGVTSNSATFTVNLAPGVSTLAPTSGAQGDFVTINGAGFGSTQDTSTVTFNGTQASIFPEWSDTSITATVPNNATTGNVVVTVGGLVSNGLPFTVVQRWAQTGSLVGRRRGETITLLNNGRVLVAGGSDQSGNSLATAEIYDPGTGTFTPTGSMITGRTGHTATLLKDGKVLIAGGVGSSFPPLGSAELYDPDTGVFSAVGNLNQVRVMHSATLLPNGLVLLVGGLDSNDFDIASAELYDPQNQTFGFTGSLQTPCDGHTATLLNSGKVLVAGGHYWNNGYTELSRVELYDPASGTFTSGGNLTEPRTSHIASLLNNGKVLLAGGQSATTGSSSASAELYDPGAGTFALTGSMKEPLMYHTSHLLYNGKVLVVGGVSAQLFDPATATFSYTDELNTPRSSYAGVVLGNGQVLVAGGADCDECADSAELYQPSTLAPAGLVSIALSPAAPSISGGGAQQFTATGTFTDSSTQILGAINWSSSNNSVATVSSDPGNHGQGFGLTAGTTTISACAGSICGSTILTVTAVPPSILVLSQGAGAVGTSIIITGANFGSQPGDSTVTFNGTPATPTSWHANSIVVPVPPGATTGNVVVTAGGVASNGVNFIVGSLSSISIGPSTPSVTVGSVLQLVATGTYSDGSTLNITQRAIWSSSAENLAFVESAGLARGLTTGQTTIQAAFGTVTGSATLTVNSVLRLTGSLHSARENHTSTLLNNGMVLVTGGWAFPFPTTTELYDPATGAFSITGSLHTLRYAHTATLLGNGLVLIAGGFGQNGTALSSAELFDPGSGAFLAADSLSTARSNHTATLLNNGKVLIVGGRDLAGNVFATSELYDPATGTFTSTGSLNAAREWHIATLLNNGKVLVSGGGGPGSSFVLNAEIYDPTTGTFTVAATTSLAGEGVAAALLNNGNVLLVDGITDAMYDMGFGSFSLIRWSTVVNGSTATLLNNGTALLTGGGGLNNAEIYDPVTGRFTSLGGMNSVRALHTATRLRDGSVLLVGGLGNNGALASAEIYQPPTLAPAGLVSISITPSSASLAAGTAQRFVATGTFSDSSTQTMASSLWSSSDNSVLVVSNDVSDSGQVYGLTAGPATVTACAGTICGTSAVTIGASVPTITAITPASGTVGTLVTVAGNGFGPLQGNSTVTFNGAPATVSRWYSGSINVAVPAAASTGNVVVTVSGVASNGLQFTMPRVITGLSATTASPGTAITISGSNFGASTGIVTFNGQATTTSSWSNNSIVAIVPTTATSGNVVVSNSGIPSNGIPFTVGPVIYGYERTITIDHRQVPNTDQVNFPVLISGTYGDLAAVGNGGKVQNPNGYDIAFTNDAAGNNKLDHEIESYDPVTGTINFWVRIPSFSHTADTVIYLQYGSAVVITSQENTKEMYCDAAASKNCDCPILPCDGDG